MLNLWVVLGTLHLFVLGLVLGLAPALGSVALLGWVSLCVFELALLHVGLGRTALPILSVPAGTSGYPPEHNASG